MNNARYLRSKTSELRTFSIRLEKPTYAKLAREAKKQKRSLAAQVDIIMEERYA